MDEWHIGDPVDWGDGFMQAENWGHDHDEEDDESQSPQPESKYDVARQLADKAWEIRNEFDIDRIEEAMDLINRAIELVPLEGNYYNIKAILLEDDYKFEEAFKFFDKALSLKDNQVIWDNKAYCIYKYLTTPFKNLNYAPDDLDLVNEGLRINSDPETKKGLLRVKGSMLNVTFHKPVKGRRYLLMADELYDDLEDLDKKTEILRNSPYDLINIAGNYHYRSSPPLNDGVVVDLIKEPSNEHDSDAIRVELEGETVGYVGNSYDTLLKCVKSASDLKDRKITKARVLFRFFEDFIIAELME